MCNGGGERTRTGQAPSLLYYTRSTGSITIYCTAVAGSCVAVSVVVTRIVRLALAIARMNNQAVTTATPASEIHIIHSATTGFVLLVNAVANPDRESWLAASTAKTR